MADEHESGPFRTALVRRGLLIPLGAEGVYGHGAAFEAVVNAVHDAITDVGSDQRATAVRLPPVYSAVDFAGTGYPQTFPHLGGVVSPFGFDIDARPAVDRAIAGPEAGQPVMPQSADLALVPAACHPAYAMHRGAEIGEARVLDVLGQCFRREPSQDPFRMQAFRQREYVYLGDPDGARAHRDRWVARSLEFLDRLGLDVAPAAAADPFFGRGGDSWPPTSSLPGRRRKRWLPCGSRGTESTTRWWPWHPATITGTTSVLPSVSRGPTGLYTHRAWVSVWSA